MHGDNFTRQGIGFRVEETLALADFTSYEIGEMFATVGVSAANTRIYMKSDNSSGIVDLGIPFDGSVTAAKLAADTNTEVFVNSEVSSGSNVFALATGADPKNKPLIILFADGVYQDNTQWIFTTANNTIQFRDATVASGIRVDTRVISQ